MRKRGINACLFPFVNVTYSLRLNKKYSNVYFIFICNYNIKPMFVAGERLSRHSYSVPSPHRLFKNSSTEGKNRFAALYMYINGDNKK
jgi:hypothetical protein